MTVESGALIIACISVFLSLLWVKISHVVTRSTLGLTSPFIVSYCLYYFPVWFSHGSVSEYAVWAPFFISIWGIVGLVASAVTISMILWIKKRKRNEGRIS